MSGLIGADSSDSSNSSSSEGAQGLAAEPPPTGSADTGTAGAGAAGAAAEEPGGEQGGKVRIWFRALLRSATALVLTLVILAICGGVADVVLHVTRHVSSHSTTYSGVEAVEVVLDGDVSLNVVGKPDGTANATLAAVDTSTPFDDPSSSASVIGGTLYLTERCPDSRCTSQLTLTLNTNDQVDIVAGNALRLDDAVIDINGIDGQTHVRVAPGKLVVTNTVVTGAVIGLMECDTEVDCRGVATVAGVESGTTGVEG